MILIETVTLEFARRRPTSANAGSGIAGGDLAPCREMPEQTHSGLARTDAKLQKVRFLSSLHKAKDEATALRVHVGRPFCRYTIWRPRSLHSTSITVFVGQWMIEGSLPPCAYLTPCPGVHTHTHIHTHTPTNKKAHKHTKATTNTHTHRHTHTHRDESVHACSSRYTVAKAMHGKPVSVCV